MVTLMPSNGSASETMSTVAYVPMNFDKPLHIGDSVLIRASSHGAHKGLPAVDLRVVKVEEQGEFVLCRFRRASETAHYPAVPRLGYQQSKQRARSKPKRTRKAAL
ncbi:hypothetical protein [Nocardia sp. NPDC052566]|uniref:hypothetical protein n=1 Tax=Nocardia sp. NPDC052566 TaxID=3364330 RepID=UPI0037CC675A